MHGVLRWGPVWWRELLKGDSTWDQTALQEGATLLFLGGKIFSFPLGSQVKTCNPKTQFEVQNKRNLLAPLYEALSPFPVNRPTFAVR
ncbi:MAG: hypothetical protein A2600_06000 [Candidatus Lambdaproteobacteria bacterium RIFOXYD1_FULL_56_27]|uniref:Uncharacterized protein n=1 Tax=Candidatus Lambdaproteobacteria bacterium RIFOXYD2_FULL_56_26 TaxID=1817773 RepID=A0A1F6GM73_9PROT|nr:MAG: hypothetical protein A2557_10125 [Candidatus Lambdaproteobacteria bacterium RIFOXYD2_FULL_56_26]OGH01761.1 MAG: hypothetical protein A2426_14035 [Candidatus Lambdaproteobacteria bacterium RIFOXYC1_FULL_56_13]OGH07634.1 MAG: hypothetical protein A2600_06000 [Candidatus Lambdaproteobacteria bacterium RIFOXYD1_FULL_56_27]